VARRGRTEAGEVEMEAEGRCCTEVEDDGAGSDGATEKKTASSALPSPAADLWGLALRWLLASRRAGQRLRSLAQAARVSAADAALPRLCAAHVMGREGSWAAAGVGPKKELGSGTCDLGNCTYIHVYN